MQRSVLALSLGLIACAPSLMPGGIGIDPRDHVVRAKQLDPDGDGIISDLELKLGSDPNAKDTDSDGDLVPDSVEVRVGTDSRKPDSDGDGFGDRFELLFNQHALSNSGTSQPLTIQDTPSGLAAKDHDGDGVISALDADDDGDGKDDKQQDPDGDTIPSHMEIQGYYFEAGSSTPLLWDGDLTKPYVKTDPAVWSTDYDPYGDGQEASGINMPGSIPFPGRHPLVPAYPDVRIYLDSVVVSPIANVTNSSGTTLSDQWTQSFTQSTMTSTTNTQEINGSLGASSQGLTGGVGGGLSWQQTLSDTNSLSTTQTQGSSFQWGNATTTDTARAANVSFNLRFYNLGTAPAKSVIPQLSLLAGTTPLLQTQLANGFDIGVGASNKYPTGSAVAINQDAKGQSLTLTLDQLRLLYSGVAIRSNMDAYSATVFSDVQPQSAALKQLSYLSSDQWRDYLQAIDNQTMTVRLDTGKEVPDGTLGADQGIGRSTALKVYSPPSPIGSWQGGATQPPKVTLRDILHWAFLSQPSSSGGMLDLRIWSPLDAKFMPMPLDATWYFGLSPDMGTDFTGQSTITSDTNLLDLSTYAGSEVLLKAPPTGNLATPKLTGSYFDFAKRKVYVGASDYYQVNQVNLTLGGSFPAIKLSPVAFDPNVPATGLGFVGDMPVGYMHRSAEEIFDVQGKTGSASLNAPTFIHPVMTATFSPGGSDEDPRGYYMDLDNDKAEEWTSYYQNPPYDLQPNAYWSPDRKSIVVMIGYNTSTYQGLDQSAYAGETFDSLTAAEVLRFIPRSGKADQAGTFQVKKGETAQKTFPYKTRGGNFGKMSISVDAKGNVIVQAQTIDALH